MVQAIGLYPNTIISDSPSWALSTTYTRLKPRKPQTVATIDNNTLVDTFTITVRPIVGYEQLQVRDRRYHKYTTRTLPIRESMKAVCISDKNSSLLYFEYKCCSRITVCTNLEVLNIMYV